MERDLVRHQPRPPGHMDAFLIFPLEFCTCATYSTLGICDGILLWLLIKEPSFTVPLRYSWKYVGVRPFRYGRVRRIVVSWVEPPHVRELKSQANPSKEGGKKRPKELLRMTLPVKVAVMGSLFLCPKRRSVSWPVGMHHGIQCACTVQFLLVVNAIRPHIRGVSFVMGAFTAWLEWSV